MMDILTFKESCELRLKCLVPFVETASKMDLERGKVFELGERAFEFVTKPPAEKPGEQPKGSKGK